MFAVVCCCCDSSLQVVVWFVVVPVACWCCCADCLCLSLLGVVGGLLLFDVNCASYCMILPLGLLFPVAV